MPNYLSFKQAFYPQAAFPPFFLAIWRGSLLIHPATFRFSHRCSLHPQKRGFRQVEALTYSYAMQICCLSSQPSDQEPRWRYRPLTLVLIHSRLSPVPLRHSARSTAPEFVCFMFFFLSLCCIVTLTLCCGKSPHPQCKHNPLHTYHSL